MRSAALIGIVAAEHIAGPHLVDRVAFHDMRDQTQKTPQMHGNVFCLAQCVSGEIEQRGGAIATFLDVRGVGCADQRFPHFLDDRGIMRCQ